MYIQRLLYRNIAYLCLSLMVAGCALPSQKPADKTTQVVERVWPAAPAKARIHYERTFASAEDLGISKGFFQHFIDFFTGETSRQLVRPMAILETANKVLYVADPGSKGVHSFDTGNGDYTLITHSRDKKDQLESPVGLAADPAGNIYVSDSAQGRVFKIAAGSEILEAVTLTPAPKQPTGIVIDPTSGDIYVVDTTNHHIKVYARDGKLLKTMGQRGEGKGDFNYPTALWRDVHGQLLVTDALNFRIQIFDPIGRYISGFGRAGNATGDMARPKGVAQDSDGHVYIVDALFHSVQVFNAKGNFLLNFGIQGQEAGEFWLPTGIFINKNNIIYIADSHNKRIQVFRYIGDRP